MRKLVENQLSWLALLMTAFYSLLASCRGEECGHEELVRCARPLEKVSSNDLSFVSTKEELQQMCPDLEAGIKCIKQYTVNCLKGMQREYFDSLYKGTNKAIMELCHEGPYQDEFLRHSPCVKQVQSEYEMCYTKYQRTTQGMERENRSESLKSLCCAFKDYLNCSHFTVSRRCGADTARFTKAFLDRMSSSLLKMHCAAFTDETCGIATAAGSRRFRIELLLPVALVALGRYFT